jgi:hypothetical protein
VTDKNLDSVEVSFDVRVYFSTSDQSEIDIDCLKSKIQWAIDNKISAMFDNASKAIQGINIAHHSVPNFSVGYIFSSNNLPNIKQYSICKECGHFFTEHSGLNVHVKPDGSTDTISDNNHVAY